TELSDSRAWIQELTGGPCTVFSPPNGKHHRRDIEAIRHAGFAGYRTVEMWSLDRPRRRAGGLLEMPTTLAALPQPVIGVAKNLVKRRAFRGLGHYLRRGLAGSWADHAWAMIDRAVAVGGVFHLWGHSWELEDSQQWDALEDVLRVIREHADAGRIRLATNGGLCASEPQPAEAILAPAPRPG
ncbi:MAG: hypothetical protein AAGL98_03220, partial [Planctomycetota bacterium]